MLNKKQVLSSVIEIIGDRKKQNKHQISAEMGRF